MKLTVRIRDALSGRAGLRGIRWILLSETARQRINERLRAGAIVAYNRIRDRCLATGLHRFHRRRQLSAWWIPDQRSGTANGQPGQCPRLEGQQELVEQGTRCARAALGIGETCEVA